MIWRADEYTDLDDIVSAASKSDKSINGLVRLSSGLDQVSNSMACHCDTTICHSLTMKTHQRSFLNSNEDQSDQFQFWRHKAGRQDEFQKVPAKFHHSSVVRMHDA